MSKITLTFNQVCFLKHADLLFFLVQSAIPRSNFYYLEDESWLRMRSLYSQPIRNLTRQTIRNIQV